VCLHNNYHRPVTEEALRAGKHVLREPTGNPRLPENAAPACR
jgi:hypothetical protein